MRETFYYFLELGSENRHRGHSGTQRKTTTLCELLWSLWLIFFATTRFYPEEIKKSHKRLEKVLFSFLVLFVLFMLIPTAEAALDVTGASCDITLDARSGDAGPQHKTVTLTLKNTGGSQLKVQQPTLTSPETGITLTKLDTYPKTISPDNSIKIEIKVDVAGSVEEGTYSTHAHFDASSDEDTFTAEATIAVNVDRLIPAHLATLPNIIVDDPVVFDRPRTEMEKTGFSVEETFQIVNDGDTRMTVKSIAPYGTPDAGMTFSTNNPSQIPEQSAEAVTLTITLPVTAPEGTHQGKLRIDCGEAGLQTITITVTVEHAVKFEMSSYKSDFGRVDLLNPVPLEITLNEALGYKDITSVMIKRADTEPGDGKGDWMTVNLPASIIPKGGSVPLTFTLKFRGETAVGRRYAWNYYLSHSAGNATISLKATSTPINIGGTRDALQTLRGSGDQEISSIAGKVFNMLESGSSGGSDDWASIASISQVSVTFLNAMGRAVQKVDGGDYEGALNDLLVARISVATMQKSAKDQSQTTICKMSNDYLTGVLQKESAYFEAMAKGATDDRTRIVAYRYAATTYDLSNEPGKSEEARGLAEEGVIAYNRKIESANSNRVDADDAVRRASDDLYRWGDAKLLVNPFVYDSTSDRYRFAINETETAAEEYRSAGEFELHNTTALRADALQSQWLFLLSQFIVLMLGYVLIFVGVVAWCVLAFTAFTADSREEEFGDVVLLS